MMHPKWWFSIWLNDVALMSWNGLYKKAKQPSYGEKELKRFWWDRQLGETIHQKHHNVNTLLPFHPTHFYQNNRDLSSLLAKYLSLEMIFIQNNNLLIKH